MRKLLRQAGSIQMWHVEEAGSGRQRAPTIWYEVVRGSSLVTFSRPHEAWRYFQQLTKVLDKDIRPEPPPIDEAFLEPRAPGSTPKRERRRRPRKPEPPVS